MTAKHLFSWDQVERLADRLAFDACRKSPSAMTPNETRVVVALLREEVERMRPSYRTTRE